MFLHYENDSPYDARIYISYKCFLKKYSLFFSQGLILDLRGNPGGLLTSAVDVSSLLVPKGSEIVSAKGRGFPGVSYRSRVDPMLDPNTKLAVLINDSTASAAEIVSGAIQDLDVGVIVGSGRSFGKGLGE